MSKLIIFSLFIISVHCGFLDGLLEEKKGLDNTVNNGITTLDMQSKPVAEGLTGLLGIKDEDKEKKDEPKEAATVKSEKDEAKKEEPKAEEATDEITTPKASEGTEANTPKPTEPAKTDKTETTPA